MHWLVSCGIHDRWTEVYRYPFDLIEKQLARIAPPGWFQWRPDSMDREMFASVNAHDEYRLDQLDLQGAKVIDVGAHIGSFALAAADRGTTEIHCYEPSYDNFACLRFNALGITGCKAFNAAVGHRSGNVEVLPWRNDLGHTGAFWTKEVEEGVPMVPIAEAIERMGMVDILKLDCEAAEWDILDKGTGFEQVNAIVGEYHGVEKAANAGWPGADEKTIKNLLERHGYHVEVWPADDKLGGIFQAKR